MICFNPPIYSHAFSLVLNSKLSVIIDSFSKMGAWEVRSITLTCAYFKNRYVCGGLSTILPSSQNLKKVWDYGRLLYWFAWEVMGMDGRFEE